MRKILAGLLSGLVLFLLCGQVQAIAEQKHGSNNATTDSEKPALTPDQIRQIREQLKEIGDLVSDPKAATEAKTEAKKEEPKKNMADVADKALSLLSGYVGIVAGVMTKIAPEVWRIMVRQQYANAVATPFVPLALLGFLAIYMAVIVRWWDKTEVEKRNDCDEKTQRLWFVNIIPFILFFIFGIWAAIELTSSVRMLINPEYYAFRDLVHILLNRGGLNP